MKTKLFFGWTNIKWGIIELIKMMSGKDSYFSLKRFQIIVAFATYISGSIWYLHHKIDKMDAQDFVLWSGPLLLICGYTLNALQSEKKMLNEKTITT